MAPSVVGRDATMSAPRTGGRRAPLPADEAEPLPPPPLLGRRLLLLPVLAMVQLFLLMVNAVRSVLSPVLLTIVRMIEPNNKLASFPHVPGRSTISDRKTLVLDMDETLIHARHADSAGQARCDLTVEVEIEDTVCKFYVCYRPHVHLFLRVAARWYNLVVFTASLREYADPILDSLDPTGELISLRFFRESCQFENGLFKKNLAAIEPDLSRVFILDNSSSAYDLQPENAIPITSWIDDDQDECLLDLLPFLYALRGTQDVRSILSLRRRG